MVKVISASTCAGIVVLDYSTYHARGPLTLPGRVFTSNKLYAYSIFRRSGISCIVIPTAIVPTRTVFKHLANVD